MRRERARATDRTAWTHMGCVAAVHHVPLELLLGSNDLHALALRCDLGATCCLGLRQYHGRVSPTARMTASSSLPRTNERFSSSSIINTLLLACSVSARWCASCNATWDARSDVWGQQATGAGTIVSLCEGWAMQRLADAPASAPAPHANHPPPFAWLPQP